jgi:NADP-dependent 3-hydroxy acid dehydrogenase YdfG
MPRPLKDKVILPTGACSSFGADAARLFAGLMNRGLKVPFVKRFHRHKATIWLPN